jgi:hypothetical protein
MSRDRRKRTGSSTAAVKARRLFTQDGTFRGIRSASEEPEREASMVNLPVGATIKAKAEAPGLFGAGASK